MATNQPFKRPATKLRGGNIKATTWQNVSEKGPLLGHNLFTPVQNQSSAWRHGPAGLCR
jgi:hypothetical protein